MPTWYSTALALELLHAQVGLHVTAHDWASACMRAAAEVNLVSQCTVWTRSCMVELHSAGKLQAAACTGEAAMYSTGGQGQAQSCHCPACESQSSSLLVAERRLS